MADGDELRNLLKRADSLLDRVKEEWLKFGVLSGTGQDLIREIDSLDLEIRRAFK